MGLREKKAERNRKRITEEAIRLFTERGFDQTTMEAIAEAAEVSPSTLYRYFPSKDLIVLAEFVSQAQRLPEVFGACSPDMPVMQALAQAILQILATTDEPSNHTVLFRAILDQSPEARARLWDLLEDLRNQLSQMVAERLKLPGNDLRVIITARLAIMIAETAADVWRAHPQGRSASSIAEDIMHLFSSNAITLPQVAQSTTPALSSRRRKATAGPTSG